jgi:hypothetical protein
MVVSMKTPAFLNILSCSITEVDQRFKGRYCLHYQGDDAEGCHLHHSICLILGFQSIWFCWAMSWLPNRTVVSTTVTKNRWLRPHNVLLWQQQVTSKECGIAHNNWQILIILCVPKGKRPLGRPRRRWEDGIRMDFREIGLGRVDWIRLSQDRDWWRAVVSAVMNLRVLAPRS